MKYLKAYLVVIMLILMWGTRIFNEWVSMIFCVLFDISDAKERKTRDPETGWLHSKLLAQDVNVNVDCGGYFRTTISSELGELKLKGSEVGTIVAEIVDWFFWKLFKQANHCVGAIEPNDRHIFNPLRMVIGFFIFMSVNIAKYAAIYLLLTEILWVLT